MMNQTAQGLASLGRGNDSMLVHMTPREVQGLQGLAMAHGGSLTINPKTGLPEAGFLDAILPTVAGFGLNAMFPGLGALGTGLLVGGATALASGDLGKGVLAGFGAGSGFGLGKTFADMGKGAVGGIPVSAAQDAAKSFAIQDLPANVAQNAATNLGMFNSIGATPTMGAVTGATVPTLSQAASTLGDATSNLGMFNTGATGATAALTPSASQIAQSQLSQPSLLDKASTRFGEMYEGGSKFLKDPFGSGYEAFKAADGNTMDLLSPVAAVGMEALKPPVYEGYQDPEAGKYRGPQGQLNLSDKFDTGLRLIAKGGYIKNYALGGAVNPNPPEGGGISDLYNRPEGVTAQSISSDGYGVGRLDNLAGEQSRYQAQTLGYAKGGDVVAGEKGMNLDKSSSLNLNLVGAPSKDVDNMGRESGGLLDALTARNLDLAQKGMYGARGVSDGILYNMMGLGRNAQLEPKSYALNLESGKQEAQYVKGGYLDGEGDGMSDSIPATIEGRQPARLADGEFVIPADVVSHLGNGSSKAGSKRLYAMLDKVRQARTGNKKQGKQIKAEKYLPA
jgi:hypothetical protein